MEYHKLQWRCRRGMRELDMVLERFLELDFPQLEAEMREAFTLLLDASDPDLYDWLLGRVTAPTAALAQVVARLQEYRPRR
jgi:antitoxin CptB